MFPCGTAHSTSNTESASTRVAPFSASRSVALGLSVGFRVSGTPTSAWHTRSQHTQFGRSGRCSAVALWRSGHRSPGAEWRRAAISATSLPSDRQLGERYVPCCGGHRGLLLMAQEVEPRSPGTPTSARAATRPVPAPIASSVPAPWLCLRLSSPAMPPSNAHIDPIPARVPAGRRAAVSGGLERCAGAPSYKGAHPMRSANRQSSRSISRSSTQPPQPDASITGSPEGRPRQYSRSRGTECPITCPMR